MTNDVINSELYHTLINSDDDTLRNVKIAIDNILKERDSECVLHMTDKSGRCFICNKKIENEDD